MSATSFYNEKFLYVVICFAIVLGSYFFRRTRVDWAWLAGGMAFTVGADYFLVMHDAHLPGVAVFCFAHVCYGLRAARWGRRGVWLFAGVGAAVAVLFMYGAVLGLATLYAGLFGFSIYMNIKKRKELNNAPLVLVGLFLFALCDVCVLLFNIPRYVGIWPNLVRVLPLVWWFYLPAQGLLAVSAVRWGNIFRKYTKLCDND